MLQNSLLLMFADFILIGHVLFVCFVVLGLVAIYIGRCLSWSWVRNRLFRLLHLCAIAIVVLQSWFGMICPLTRWEMALRAEAGADAYSGSFIQHWLQAILYYSAPEWVFLLVYTLFAGLIVASWFIVRPKSR
jgi:hypothetical protein